MKIVIVMLLSLGLLKGIYAITEYFYKKYKGLFDINRFDLGFRKAKKKLRLEEKVEVQYDGECLITSFFKMIYEKVKENLGMFVFELMSLKSALISTYLDKGKENKGGKSDANKI